MPLIKFISPGANGWNNITYVDDNKYIGYTINNELRHGYGTLYANDGSIIKQGLWENDVLIESIEEPEFGRIVNQIIHQRPHW